jgi:hypothetical protein
MTRSQRFEMASARVTTFCSGIAQQLCEIDGYYPGWSRNEEVKKEENKYGIEELSNKCEVQEEGQFDGGKVEGKESEMEEERDAHLHSKERGKSSPGFHIPGGFAVMDDRWKSKDDETRGDNTRAHIDETVPEVSASTSYKEVRTVRNAVTFSKQPANVDHIEYTTSSTPKALALDIGIYDTI